MLASSDAKIDDCSSGLLTITFRERLCQTELLKKPSDTLPDEEPPPYMSRWPKSLQVAES